MYSLKLLLRPFPNEFNFVSHSFANYSVPSIRGRRMVNRTNNSEIKLNVTKLEGRRPVQRERSEFDTTSMQGVRRQVQYLGYTPEELEEVENLEDLAFHEMNMSAADNLYVQHESEVAKTAQNKGLAMYRHKYYKMEKQPSLLTWEDMCQIRRLHQQEKWPVEDLAKSFPASEYIIQRVLKINYSPNYDRIMKYDQRVEENWELLKKGKLKISEELGKHCLKFTNRKRFPTIVKDLVQTKKPDFNVKGVFSQLLLKPGEATKEEMKMEMKMKEQEEAEEYIEEDSRPGHFDLMKRFRKKIYTLENEREKELELVAEGKELSGEGRAFVLGDSSSIRLTNDDELSSNKNIHESQNQEQSVVTKVKSPEPLYSKWDSAGQSKMAIRDAVTSPVDKYPEKITIPETARRPGALYRYEDCFYDNNGLFLYRVPGLKP